MGVAYDTNLDRATQTLNAAVIRVQRVLKDPPPLVVLHEFGTSSIDFTIYYWHASDVPSELATTHDLMLAIHHAFADDDITIAFPQVVVWPGHEADNNPYDAAPGAVHGFEVWAPDTAIAREHLGRAHAWLGRTLGIGVGVTAKL